MKIYALIKNNKPVYIGATNKKYLCHKAVKHRNRNRDFDNIILIEETNDISREAYWIKYYDTYNNGSNHTRDGSNKKLFESDVIDIRNRKSNKEQRSNVFKDYSNIVTQQGFDAVWYNRTWKHIKSQSN